VTVINKTLVQLKPSAPAARSLLSNAVVQTLRLKTLLLDPAVHVVSLQSLKRLQLPRLGLTHYTGARPAGSCTCDRAGTENATVSGSLCSCGARPAGRFLTLSS